MRVIALIASYNEERFIGACLEHLTRHGVEAYLCDNESSDRTVSIAGRYLGRGLIGIETLPRGGVYDWTGILRRKEELARSLEADWFMHADPDEIRLPPRSDQTLAKALEEAQAAGYNAVNFIEYTFLPTRESPDHDHPDFQRTMRWYYPFSRCFPNQVKAWRKPLRGRGLERLWSFGRRRDAELAWSGGHRVRFPGLRLYPESFPMRHYLFLSPAHALQKYGGRGYSPREVGDRWHGWRAAIDAAAGTASAEPLLPSAAELRFYSGDDALDASAPLTRHVWAEQWADSLRSDRDCQASRSSAGASLQSSR